MPIPACIAPDARKVEDADDDPPLLTPLAK
jgi:hypothetical protein